MRYPSFIALFGIVALATIAHGASSREVVVYASQDQVFAEPILKQFEHDSGIKVRSLFDSEAVKTVGLANRLMLEKSHPQCDVFWNNEELRTRQLEAAGVVNSVVRMGHRSRRIIINTNYVDASRVSRDLCSLTNASWNKKVALAYPLFGTTATHFMCLRSLWSPPVWENWCRALQANHPFVVDGNSAVVDLVGRGEAWIGLTDSDDFTAGLQKGYPIAELPLASTSLLIPNTVAIVPGAKHPAEAQALVKYLSRPETLSQLVKAGALESAVQPALDPISRRDAKVARRLDTIPPLASPARTPPGEGGGEGQDSTAVSITPDWNRILADLDPATKTLKQIFLR